MAQSTAEVALVLRVSSYQACVDPLPADHDSLAGAQDEMRS